ncbi:MAG: DUF4258 domain-containing protein [Eudoraea sp.]|nr:DUF4258 domain-containing protein [Eudoraea sp.]
MAFLKRLGYYLVGLAIGIVILTFLLKKKTTETGTSFCYFPNCRVLKELRSKPLTFSSDVEQALITREVDTLEILNLLNDGDVNFGESDTEASPCKIFLVVGSIKQKEASLTFRNCEDATILESITYQYN